MITAITATDLPRFMACNGSRSMADTPTSAVERDDTVRQEGIAAHWLVEQVKTGRFTAEELVDRKADNDVFITADMVEYLEEYLEAVIPVGKIETDTSFILGETKIAARADWLHYDSGGVLHVDDLKYGWAIVEPEYNWTLIAHAIGWYFKTGSLPYRVVFTVHQPRPHHAKGRVRSWMITGEELLFLRDQLARTLANPSDTLQTSKECRNCPALATCPAARTAGFNAIEASESVFMDEISNEGLSFQLDHLHRAQEMLKQLYAAYSDLAIHRLRTGANIPNYCVESGLSDRKWQQGITADVIHALTGKKVTEEKLLSPAKAEKLGIDKTTMKALTTRDNTGFKLSRRSVNARAEKLFNPKGK